jgi:hypothetical protein
VCKQTFKHEFASESDINAANVLKQDLEDALAGN